MASRPSRRQAEPSFPGNPPPAEIKATRVRADISQAAAAKLIYKTTRAWELWEAGKRRMDPAFWDLFLRRISEDAPGSVQ
ncbi:XRE family transcriptional regulator [Ralstonia insidiosa]|jgi:DNA-binding transcriptional regulator YiaG|nr:XRE family transcriptional regulator [Ralstonia insidiosa]MBA9939847.1 XRE family transcriptional regulator [Ralstonia insidiosa]MBC9968513.1 XRE family transcriptional regulator [Ralstonia insidiosa]MBX3904666.1 XRE family transcriptional regulator [Ralstonia insidiosa]